MRDEIAYDPDKSAWNLEHRGFDLDCAARIFEGVVVEWDSARQSEPRIKAAGRVEGRYLTVVYTWRGGRRRIISARPARRSERDAYDAQTA